MIYYSLNVKVFEIVYLQEPIKQSVDWYPVVVPLLIVYPQADLPYGDLSLPAILEFH